EARRTGDRGRALRAGRGLLGVRGGARPRAPRARDLRACVDSRRGVDHRRRDEARAGARERCRLRGRMVPVRRRARGAGPALIRRTPGSHRRLITVPYNGSMRLTLLAATGLLTLLATGAHASSGAPGTACALPRGAEHVTLRPGDFTTRITNP